jgi:hypothetical protein
MQDMSKLSKAQQWCQNRESTQLTTVPKPLEGEASGSTSYFQPSQQVIRQITESIKAEWISQIGTSPVERARRELFELAKSTSDFSGPLFMSRLRHLASVATSTGDPEGEKYQAAYEQFLPYVSFPQHELVHSIINVIGTSTEKATFGELRRLLKSSSGNSL